MSPTYIFVVCMQTLKNARETLMIVSRFVGIQLVVIIVSAIKDMH